MQSRKELFRKTHELQNGVAYNLLFTFKLALVPTLAMAVWIAVE
jgi:hypothetical protein